MKFLVKDGDSLEVTEFEEIYSNSKKVGYRLILDNTEDYSPCDLRRCLTEDNLSECALMREKGDISFPPLSLCHFKYHYFEKDLILDIILYSNND